ncbi:MAG: hypothetical protein ACPGD5_00330 [Salibacteraceae bacterium]
MLIKSSISSIAVLLLLILTVFSCKKEEETPEPSNTGIFTGMTQTQKVLIPKQSPLASHLNNGMVMSNQYIYGVNEDGVFQMDFEGNSTVFLPKGDDSPYSVKVAKDGFVYVMRFSSSGGSHELVKLDENGNVDGSYLMPKDHQHYFGLDVTRNYVYLVEYQNRYEIQCYNYVTGDAVRSFGKNGTGVDEFENQLSLIASDQNGFVYTRMSQNKKGIIFNNDGVFYKTIEDVPVQYMVWNGGYYINDYGFTSTTMLDNSGESLGTHVHNIAVNGYFFEEEVSPDRNAAVIKHEGYFYIYTK